MKWKPSKVEGKQEAQRGGSANSCADYTHISAKYTHTHRHRHTHKSQCNECVKGWLRKGEGEAETESAHQCDSVHETRCQRLGQGCLQYIQRRRVWESSTTTKCLVKNNLRNVRASQQMLLADDGTHGVCALQIKQLNELRASERESASD